MYQLPGISKPAFVWSNSIEAGALTQFREAMEQEWVVQGALMPDAHKGYSLPIGGVVATDGVVVPAYVGYDIGCGMCALATTFDVDQVRKSAPEIFADITNEIPLGFNVHQQPIEIPLNERELSLLGYDAFNERKGFRHLGTLGGGNHFIEIGATNFTEQVWIIIHSGSRGVGHGIASAWMAYAARSPKPKEGHYALDVHTEAGHEYINDLNWCLEFALENRRLMISKVYAIIERYCDGWALYDDLINRNHNHAELKGNVWIHRKGATHAELGMAGVIPGNMRDGSYIVTGKGNPDALWSSSHGAGRAMGRKQAKRELDPEEFQDQMVDVVCDAGLGTLDEAPDAYKDIKVVMDEQSDLVSVQGRVLPIINVKG